jgi:hypothetical protein
MRFQRNAVDLGQLFANMDASGADGKAAAAKLRDSNLAPAPKRPRREVKDETSDEPMPDLQDEEV